MKTRMTFTREEADELIKCFDGGADAVAVEQHEDHKEAWRPTINGASGVEQGTVHFTPPKEDSDG